MNIVLLEPEIPQNTGNIVRTCVATGAVLHLVKPLGFSVKDKYLKRAGLDYWSEAKINYYESYNDLIKKNKGKKFYYASTKSLNVYSDIDYNKDDFIVFGKETAGIPEDILRDNKENCIRIPMKNSMRSLNLSNSVAIVLYETLRQNEFYNLIEKGNLTKYSWD